jgi:hypothetical protein
MDENKGCPGCAEKLNLYSCYKDYHSEGVSRKTNTNAQRLHPEKTQ